jgi:hypothetical protein
VRQEGCLGQFREAQNAPKNLFPVASDVQPLQFLALPPTDAESLPIPDAR